MKILLACGKRVSQKRVYDHIRECPTCRSVKWSIIIKKDIKRGGVRDGVRV